VTGTVVAGEVSAVVVTASAVVAGSTVVLVSEAAVDAGGVTGAALEADEIVRSELHDASTASTPRLATAATLTVALRTPLTPLILLRSC
jgi:hypothetical protein